MSKIRKVRTLKGKVKDEAVKSGLSPDDLVIITPNEQVEKIEGDPVSFLLERAKPIRSLKEQIKEIAQPNSGPDDKIEIVYLKDIQELLDEAAASLFNKAEWIMPEIGEQKCVVEWFEIHKVFGGGGGASKPSLPTGPLGPYIVPKLSTEDAKRIRSEGSGRDSGNYQKPSGGRDLARSLVVDGPTKAASPSRAPVPEKAKTVNLVVTREEVQRQYDSMALDPEVLEKMYQAHRRKPSSLDPHQIIGKPSSPTSGEEKEASR